MSHPPKAPETVPLAASSSTTALLWCGVAAGPLFVASVVVQELTRDGFDPARHALSQLSLGEHGWIQTATFVVAGVLALASALGLRRLLHRGPAGTWGPLLIGLYGFGMIWGGVFPTDPAAGFPPGTPDTASEQSWHGILHNLAPVFTGLTLIAACLVFARRFARQGRHGWAGYSLLTAPAYLVAGFAAFPLEDMRWLLIGGALLWLWASAVTLRLITESQAAGGQQ
ncbi:DUF998 domain-containing protein [Nonomuraea sp. NPDC048916]|uniref:DUF998 domain-containing protein n=1 Tax=Nonomuraea sp. NPDC048916 TaxID=3154232 RepID=UPI0034031517